MGFSIFMNWNFAKNSLHHRRFPENFSKVFKKNELRYCKSQPELVFPSLKREAKKKTNLPGSRLSFSE